MPTQAVRDGLSQRPSDATNGTTPEDTHDIAIFVPQSTAAAEAGRVPHQGVIGVRRQQQQASPSSTRTDGRDNGSAAAPAMVGAAASASAESGSDVTLPRAALLAERAAAVAAQQQVKAHAVPATPVPPATQAPMRQPSDVAKAVIARRDVVTGRPRKPCAPARPATAWGVHAAQVVAWQLAVGAALIAIHQPVPRMIPMLAGMVAVLVCSIARSDGRWAYQWLGIWLRFVCRRRSRVVNAGAPINELLRPFLRGARLGSIELDDVDKALLVHAAGLTVVLEAAPADDRLGASAGTVPPPTVLLPLGDDASPPISAQLIVQTVPAPSAYRARGAAAQSYHALTHSMIPARRRSWIALQAMRRPLDTGTDDAELRAALLRAVIGLRRRLGKAGMHAHVVDATQLAEDLAALSDTEAMLRDDTAYDVHLQERWSSWSAGSHPQVSYRLLDWPDLATATGQEFFDDLVSLPSVATTVGIAARRTVAAGRDRLELEVALRIGVPLDQPDFVATRLRDVTDRHRVRAQRMDGEQVFGVAATLPLGGFIT